MGPGSKGATEAAAGSMTFTQEMRAKAMSLHTFSQAPKEGKVADKSANTVVAQWETTKEDFLQFLTDSLVAATTRPDTNTQTTATAQIQTSTQQTHVHIRALHVYPRHSQMFMHQVVYEAFESKLTKADLSVLQNSGMERVEALKTDISFIKSTYGLSAPAPSPQATEYADYLQSLDTNVFVVHFYNYYFAHTAGGRMIGQTVMDSVFGGHLFEFYKWERDVKEILTEVKAKIDTVADKWTREQKDASLAATGETFNKSVALLRVLVGKARDRAAQKIQKVQAKAGKITQVPTSTYTLRKAAWDV